MAQSQRIGITANPRKPDAGKHAGDLAERFRGAGCEVAFGDTTGLLLNDDGMPLAKLAQEVDIMVVLGGDGTLLYTAHATAPYEVPLAGINLGTLGFMTAATLEAKEAFVEALVSGVYTTSHRAMLAVEVRSPGEETQTFYGLNEVTLSRGGISQMIRVETRVDGELLNHYHADGLIIATPTGSTAYSLSAGGPIVAPGAGVFVITPICPHALSDRAVVVSENATVQICASESRDDVVLTVDNHVLLEGLDPATKVNVSRADFDLPLVQMKDYRFFDVLHRKLGW